MALISPATGIAVRDQRSPSPSSEQADAEVSNTSDEDGAEVGDDSAVDDDMEAEDDFSHESCLTTKIPAQTVTPATSLKTDPVVENTYAGSPELGDPIIESPTTRSRSIRAKESQTLAGKLFNELDAVSSDDHEMQQGREPQIGQFETEIDHNSNEPEKGLEVNPLSSTPWGPHELFTEAAVRSLKDAAGRGVRDQRDDGSASGDISEHIAGYTDATSAGAQAENKRKFESDEGDDSAEEELPRIRCRRSQAARYGQSDTKSKYENGVGDSVEVSEQIQDFQTEIPTDSGRNDQIVASEAEEPADTGAETEEDDDEHLEDIVITRPSAKHSSVKFETGGSVLISRPPINSISNKDSSPHFTRDTSVATPWSATFQAKTPKLVLSSMKLTGPQTKWIKSQKISIVDGSPGKKTHYVCVVRNGSLPTTLKVLKALLANKPVVRQQWLADSRKEGQLQDLNLYIPVELQSDVGADARKAVFAHKTIFFTNSAVEKCADWQGVKEVMMAAGAFAVETGSAHKGSNLSPASDVILIGENDKKDLDAAQLLREKHAVYDKSLLAKSIVSAHIDLDGCELLPLDS